MSRSETGSTGNRIIDRQKALLAELDAEGVQDPPLSAPGAPPAEPPQPQEPPAAPIQATPPAPDPAPSSGTTSDQAQALADLQAQVLDLQHRLESSQGRLVPVQNQLSAVLAENASLKQQRATPPTARGSQGPDATPAPPAPADDDPDLKEFLDTYGDMAPGLEKLIARKLRPVLEKIQPVVEHQQQTEEQDALDTLRWEHTAPVREKYPQVASIVSSTDFRDYLDKLPVWARDNAYDMFSNPERHDTAKQIAFLDEYSAARGRAPVPPAPLSERTAPVPDPSTIAVNLRTVPSNPQPQSQGPVPLTPARLAQIRHALTRDRSLYTPDQIKSLEAELDQGEMVATQQGRGLAPSLRTLA